MQDDKQSPLMQIAPRMLAIEQKPCLGELESNVLFLHSNSGDPDNLAETAQVGFLLPFWQGHPPVLSRLVTLHGTYISSLYDNSFTVCQKPYHFF